ncbi:hypothetical protein EXN32_23120 [Agrobacterium tumefaciens]|uniref:hypothetical protein n=1 Tax=Agrobacterium TaxID=357 RepID=UPI00115E834C|nr:MULTISPECIES: hypothetical protein [Agrobacterium]MDA5240645.1 hypothetical protein [Agrobacterium sp. MAFF310724]MDA5249816.1 hypothetical protein [Agrobacterium sp. MAFF210268]TRB11761.1 hypothetical protein EXN32_23120 [Agrobacterium tumefaciens]
MYKKYKKLNQERDQIATRCERLRSQIANTGNDSVARLLAADHKLQQQSLDRLDGQIAELSRKYQTQILNGIAADARARAEKPE